MKRVWHVEMVYSVELLRLGRLFEDVLRARPEDAGPSTVDRLKIRPIDPSLGIADGFVWVLARGVEL